MWDPQSCTGPRPVVYLNDGPHSGTGLVTSGLSNLTGSYVDPRFMHWPEIMGNNEIKAKELQSPLRFMNQFFCNSRRQDPRGSLAGFKWNTFGHRYVDTPEFDEAWEQLAKNKVPVLHVLRNELSSIISTAKHEGSPMVKPNTTVRVLVGKDPSNKLKPGLKERLDHIDEGRTWLKGKYTKLGANVKISSFEQLLHESPGTRLKEWKDILRFYGAHDVAESLTIKQLDQFLDWYKKLVRGEPDRPYEEVVENWEEVKAELTRMKRSYRVSLASRKQADVTDVPNAPSESEQPPPNPSQ
jgi:hypothetical protein